MHAHELKNTDIRTSPKHLMSDLLLNNYTEERVSETAEALQLNMIIKSNFLCFVFFQNGSGGTCFLSFWFLLYL